MSTNRSGRGRVLVAEDDPSILMITLRVLNNSGYDVEGAEDGELAWEALGRDRFDLLITDNSMPRLSGIELLKRVRMAQMDLPVVMASAVLPTQEILGLPWLDIRAQLQKPYSPNRLLDSVAGILASGQPPPGSE